MKKFIVLTFLAFTPFFLGAQASFMGKSKINTTHKWEKPTMNDMGFHIHSADRKARSFYVLINNLYVPISSSTGYSIGMQYSLPMASKIVLYKREIKDGEEVFIPELTIDKQKLSDFVIGLFEVNGKLNYKLLDISLEAMPIGSATVVNMQPFPLGLSYLDKKGKLGFYNKATEISKASGKYGRGYIEVYSLQNPNKPGLLWPGDLRYMADERLIMYVFGVKIKTTPYPDESDNQINVVSDKGPRSR